MSYPSSAPDFMVPAPPPGPMSRRPGSVTVAAWFLFGAAVCLGLLVIVVADDLVNYPAWADAAAAKLHTDPAVVASSKSDNTGSDIATIVVLVVLMAGLVASGVMALRRMRTGQIMAYVLASLTILCCGVGSAVGIATASDSVSSFDQATMDAAPGWTDVLPIVTVAAFPLAITALILLLMPSARGFFRRTPNAPAGYMYLPAPGFPGAPVYPGYPAYQPLQQWVAPTYPPPPPYHLPPPDAPPAVASPWAVPGSTTPDPGEGATGPDQTRQDPDQS